MDNPETGAAYVKSAVPLRRLGSADEVASTIAFLLSDDASWITGETVTIDGGNPAFRERFPTVPQGISADLIATIEGFTRADVDTFAAESQRRAAVAIEEARFERGISPVTGPDGEVVLGAVELNAIVCVFFATVNDCCFCGAAW